MTLEVVDLRDWRDELLLDHLYQRLYLPNFQTPEQQEDPSIWKPLLWGPPPPPPKPILHILVAGHDLQTPQRRALHGFLIFEFFRASVCGLLTYLAVDANMRRRGTARLLLSRAQEQLRTDARAQGAQLRAVFAEVNDPARVHEAEGGTTPGDRLKVFERLGARRVPVRYVQPQLKAGRGRSDTLLLIALPAGPEPLDALPSKTVKAFLTEFFQSLGVDQPDRDPDFARMLEDLRGERIALSPNLTA
jgi:GNAT superfamily N-acetyltransferase